MMLCADFTRLSIWWMGLREYCMLNSLFSISNFRASCFTADSYMFRMTRNSCVLSNEPACVLSIIRTVRSVLLYPKTGPTISKYIIPYICDFFYCFCFNSPFWGKHGFWRKAVRYFLQKKIRRYCSVGFPTTLLLYHTRSRLVNTYKTKRQSSYISIKPNAGIRISCRLFFWEKYAIL